MLTVEVVGCLLVVPVAVLGLLVRDGGNPLVAVDRSIVAVAGAAVAGHSGLTSALILITDLGSPWAFRIAALLAALWLVFARKPRLAAWAIGTVWGGTVVVNLGKWSVARTRPDLPGAVATESGYSFPSGHAFGAAVGCITLVMLWLPYLRRVAALRRWPAALVVGVVWSAAGIVVVLVGYTRIALGVHYATDVVAGWFAGVSWVSATVLVVLVASWRRDHGRPRASLLACGLQPTSGTGRTRGRPAVSGRERP